MSDNDRERHELLRDLRDATRAAREASAELARRLKLAEEWDLGYRCCNCGKRERATGALCAPCATKILGAATKDMIERNNPGAQVHLRDCIDAMHKLIVGHAAEAYVPDVDGAHEYVTTPPPNFSEIWHAGDSGRA